MKKFTKYPIKAATDNTVLKSDDGLFALVKDSGVGMNDTPYEDLEVRSFGDADKFVVEIRFDRTHHRFNGEPVQYKIKSAYVAHGMSGNKETLDDTVRYIEVLESAVDFAQDCMKWITKNGYLAK